MKKTDSLKSFLTTAGEFVPISSKLKHLVFGLTLVLSWLISMPAGQAQCVFTCIGNYNVSLDTVPNGTLVVTPAMVASPATLSSCANVNLTVTLTDGFGKIVPNNTLTCKYVKHTIKYSISGPNNYNSCWGYIYVEDKAGPNLFCVKDTIYCSDLDRYYAGKDRFPNGMAHDNCGGTYPVTVSVNCVEYPCDSVDFAGLCVRRVIAKDRWGTTSSCVDSFWILRLPLDSITCPADTMFECYEAASKDLDHDGRPDPKFSGVPGIYIADYDGNGNDTTISAFPTGSVCKTYTNYKDHIFPICGTSKKIRRTWEIIDWCRDTTIQCVQWIKILDTLPPPLKKYNDTTYAVQPHDCAAKITIPVPLFDSADCSPLGMAHVEIFYYDPEEKANFTDHKVFQRNSQGKYIPLTFTLPAGQHEAIVYVADSCLNTAIDTFIIDVKDLTPPTPVCDQHTVTTLDPNSCWARVYAETFDDGSTDNCCPDLHFAAARMDTLEYYRNYWRNLIVSRFSQATYIRYKKEFDRYIEMVLDIRVFNDYIDFYNCQKDKMIVTRVYEKCHLTKYYDSHIHGSSEHQFFAQETYGKHYGYITGKDINSGDPVKNRYSDAQLLDNLLQYIDEFRNFRTVYYGECMVEIDVDDKIGPVCTPKPDVTVFCDGVIQKPNAPSAEYAQCNNTIHGGDGWSSFNGNGFSLSPYDNCDTCSYWLLLDGQDVRIDPLSLFNTPDVFDNCAIDSSKTVITTTPLSVLDDCGEGILTRTWTFFDFCGNSTTCSQRVNVRQRSDFEVEFPKDTVLNCATERDLDPEEGIAGRPIISDDECEQIGISFKDEVFTIVEDACLKVVRTWTIINWCKYDPDAKYHAHDICNCHGSLNCVASSTRDRVNRFLKDNGDGYMRYTQVIKVRNNDDPTITIRSQNIVCANNSTTCMGSARIVATATDPCTDSTEIKWTILIDYGRTGTFVWYGQTIGDSAVYNNSSAPVGNHTVRFIASDRCGNQTTLDRQFSVDLCKRPTPYCKNLIIALMPVDNDGNGTIDNGMVEVWASDFDNGSFAYCNQRVVKITFDSAGLVPSRTFTCADLGVKNLQMWVIDSWGNRDRCDVQLTIQANSFSCGPTGANTAQVTGQIVTEGNEGIAKVNVELKGSAATSTSTGTNGVFNFASMPVGGSYEIIPGKNINPNNGISTLDLVHIQKHILGLENLTSPYRMIAADIDNNKKITATDLVALRRVILGIDDKFASNQSWRFVSKDYKFADAANPFTADLNEKYAIVLSKDMKADFIGIKVGDVNGSVTPSELKGAEVRSNQSLELVTENLAFEAGQEVRLPITSANFNQVLGYQFTLEYNAALMTYTGAESGAIQLDNSNFGVQKAKAGLITTSWHQANPVTVKPEEVLFTLIFTANAAGEIEKALTVNDKITQAEAYNQHLEASKVALKFTARQANNSFVLYQNTPNPFNQQTVIGFTLPAAGQATLKIMDVTGKTLSLIQGDYTKGYNEIRLNQVDLKMKGVLYYQLESAQYTATKKMIVLE